MSGARRGVMMAALVIAAPAIMLGVALAGAAVESASPATASVTACAAPTAGGKDQAASLSSVQVGNAQVIYDVSVSLGLPSQAAVIAIATAMQESTLINLPYGTADSLGLFQQRPSQGWGSPAQIMQPVYASTEFYDALVRVPGWQSLPLTVAAQDVQHSAYPEAYAQWRPLAETLVAEFSGAAADCADDNGRGVPASGTTHLPTGFTLPAGTPTPVVTAIAYAVAQLGKPYIWGGTGPHGFDCSGLVYSSYRHHGVKLPRTTGEMLGNWHLKRISKRQARRGDLAFFGTGHVELYDHGNWTFGAARPGTRIGYHRMNAYWHPTMYFRVRRS